VKEAGWGTDHLGQGRCKLHGGATPIKHGRYSLIRRDGIRELIEQHEKDPDPLNILPELAAARALFQDFIERYDENTEALLAWHASYEQNPKVIAEDTRIAFESCIDDLEEYLRSEGEPTERQTDGLAKARKFIAKMAEPAGETKPRQVLDISDAYRIVSEITKIVERIEKIRSQNAISRPELLRVMTEMGRVVERYVEDKDVLGKIKDGWIGIRVA